jgi:hypothetical protein
MITSILSARVSAMVEGPRGSPSCQRAACVPQARQKYAEGVGRSRAYVVGVGHSRAYVAGIGRFDDVVMAWARQKPLPEEPISPETFPQGSGGMEVGSRLRTTDILSAPLTGRFYRGPYDGALADVQGAVFCHPLWYFDSRQRPSAAHLL